MTENNVRNNVQGKDMSFKYISKEHFGVMLNILLPDLEINPTDDIEFLTSEMIDFKSSLYRPDFVVRINDLILMIEFQSSYVPRELSKKFRSYTAVFDYLNNPENLDIFFCVLSTAEKSKIKKHRVNRDIIFKYPLFSLSDLNKTQIINTITEKNDHIKELFKQGVPLKQVQFSEEELIPFALTPIIESDRDKIIEQFKINAEIMGDLVFPDEDLRESVYGISMMLVDMYFDINDPVRIKLKDDYMFKVDMVNEYGKEQYDAGVKDNRIDVAKRMLDENMFPIDLIAKFVALPVDEIIKLNNQR